MLFCVLQCVIKNIVLPKHGQIGARFCLNIRNGPMKTIDEFCFSRDAKRFLKNLKKLKLRFCASAEDSKVCIHTRRDTLALFCQNMRKSLMKMLDEFELYDVM